MAAVVAIVTVGLGWASAAQAVKVDTLTLRNGDHITGEIKSLNRGRLSYGTDDAGTLSVEWDKVARLYSPRMFDLELASGRHLYGSLQPAPSAGLVRIAEAADTLVVGILEVVHISPLEKSVIERIDGSLDFGLSLSRANNFVQTTVDAAVRYRTQFNLFRLRANSLIIKQDDAEDTQRGSVALEAARILGGRWYAATTTGVERNLELGLDMRVSLAALGGRFIAQTNAFTFSAAAGLSGNLENPSSDASWNLEAVGLLDAGYFTYDYPKTDVGGTLTVYQGLTEAGTRLEFEATAKREIIKDFTLGVSGVDSYDSDPPSGGNHNDWNLQLIVGWTF